MALSSNQSAAFIDSHIEFFSLGIKKRRGEENGEDRVVRFLHRNSNITQKKTPNTCFNDDSLLQSGNNINLNPMKARIHLLDVC